MDDWDDELFLLSRFWLYLDSQKAFVTSATTFVCPVVEIDGIAISTGQHDPVVNRLNEVYIEESRKATI